MKTKENYKESVNVVTNYVDESEAVKTFTAGLPEKSTTGKVKKGADGASEKLEAESTKKSVKKSGYIYAERALPKIITDLLKEYGFRLFFGKIERRVIWLELRSRVKNVCNTYEVPKDQCKKLRKVLFQYLINAKRGVTYDMEEYTDNNDKKAYKIIEERIFANTLPLPTIDNLAATRKHDKYLFAVNKAQKEAAAKAAKAAKEKEEKIQALMKAKGFTREIAEELYNIFAA